jgi:hypothetical protein
MQSPPMTVALHEAVKILAKAERRFNLSRTEDEAFLGMADDVAEPFRSRKGCAR